MMKNTAPVRIAFFLTLAALVPLAAQTAPNMAPGFETEPASGGAVITKYTGPGGAVTIPASIDGKSVIGIGESTFRGCINLASVTIPEGVVSIGNEAFVFCSSLRSITIPDSVTSIGYGAFGVCLSLKPEVRADIEKRFGSRVF
jgi:hypothetical protein